MFQNIINLSLFYFSLFKKKLYSDETPSIIFLPFFFFDEDEIPSIHVDTEHRHAYVKRTRTKNVGLHLTPPKP